MTIANAYRIVSAAWGNPEHTCAIIRTAERGAVAVSERDRPDFWAALVEFGMEKVTAYKKPEIPMPDFGHPTAGGQDLLAEDMGKPVDLG